MPRQVQSNQLVPIRLPFQAEKSTSSPESSGDEKKEATITSMKVSAIVGLIFLFLGGLSAGISIYCIFKGLKFSATVTKGTSFGPSQLLFISCGLMSIGYLLLDEKDNTSNKKI